MIEGTDFLDVVKRNIHNSTAQRLRQVRGFITAPVRRFTTVLQPMLTLTSLPTATNQPFAASEFGEQKPLPWQTGEIRLKLASELYSGGLPAKPLVAQLCGSNPKVASSQNPDRLAVVTLHWKRGDDLMRWLSYLEASVAAAQHESFTVDLFVWNNNELESTRLQTQLASINHGAGRVVRSTWVHHSEQNIGPFGEWVCRPLMRSSHKTQYLLSTCPSLAECVLGIY